jgi:hypothetical protein
MCCHVLYFTLFWRVLADHNSVISKATQHMLHSLGLNPGRGEFSVPIRPELGPTHPSVQFVLDPSQGAKQPGRGVEQRSQSKHQC